MSKLKILCDVSRAGKNIAVARHIRRTGDTALGTIDEAIYLPGKNVILGKQFREVNTLDLTPPEDSVLEDAWSFARAKVVGFRNGLDVVLRITALKDGSYGGVIPVVDGEPRPPYDEIKFQLRPPPNAVAPTVDYVKAVVADPEFMVVQTRRDWYVYRLIEGKWVSATYKQQEGLDYSNTPGGRVDGDDSGSIVVITHVNNATLITNPPPLVGAATAYYSQTDTIIWSYAAGKWSSTELPPAFARIYLNNFLGRSGITKAYSVRSSARGNILILSIISLNGIGGTEEIRTRTSNGSYKTALTYDVPADRAYAVSGLTNTWAEIITGGAEGYLVLKRTIVGTSTLENSTDLVYSVKAEQTLYVLEKEAPVLLTQTTFSQTYHLRLYGQGLVLTEQGGSYIFNRYSTRGATHTIAAHFIAQTDPLGVGGTPKLNTYSNALGAWELVAEAGAVGDGVFSYAEAYNVSADERTIIRQATYTVRPSATEVTVSVTPAIAYSCLRGFWERVYVAPTTPDLVFPIASYNLGYQADIDQIALSEDGQAVVCLEGDAHRPGQIAIVNLAENSSGEKIWTSQKIDRTGDGDVRSVSRATFITSASPGSYKVYSRLGDTEWTVRESNPDSFLIRVAITKDGTRIATTEYTLDSILRRVIRITPSVIEKGSAPQQAKGQKAISVVLAGNDSACSFFTLDNAPTKLICGLLNGEYLWEQSINLTVEVPATRAAYQSYSVHTTNRDATPFTLLPDVRGKRNVEISIRYNTGKKNQLRTFRYSY